MANLFEPDFDAEQDRPGFSWRRARLARQADAERLGASLFELPAGQAAFPVGARGAHQIVNRAAEPVRFLIVSEMNAPEIVVYPDSGKLFARDQPPGGRPVEIGGAFFPADAVDYFAGEPEPE